MKQYNYFNTVINTWDLWLTVNTSDSHKEFYQCTFDLSTLENSVNMINCDFFGCKFINFNDYRESNKRVHMKDCSMHDCFFDDTELTVFYVNIMTL